jgi:hypothetical protein
MHLLDEFLAWDFKSVQSAETRWYSL